MKGWKVRPEKFAAKTRKDFAEMLATIGLQVYTNLVNMTPVDTGRARSNWIASVGEPSGDTRGVQEPFSLIIQASTTFKAERVTNFPVLFIANNLPYIQRLNDGWSQQAPAGFVERAVDSVL